MYDRNEQFKKNVRSACRSCNMLQFLYNYVGYRQNNSIQVYLVPPLLFCTIVLLHCLSCSAALLRNITASTRLSELNNEVVNN